MHLFFWLRAKVRIISAFDGSLFFEIASAAVARRPRGCARGLDA